MAHEIDIHLDPEEAAHVVAADPAEPVVPVVGPEEANLGRDRVIEKGQAAGGRRIEALVRKAKKPAPEPEGIQAIVTATRQDRLWELTDSLAGTAQKPVARASGEIAVVRDRGLRPGPSYGSFDAEVVGWRQIVEGVQDEDRDTAEESEAEAYDPEGIVVTPEAFVPVDDLLNVAGTDLSPLHGVNAAIFAGHEELDERFMSQAEREEERARTIDEYTDYAATAEDLRQ